MNFEVLIEYIISNALKTILEYENKRELSLEDLKNYIIYLLKNNYQDKLYNIKLTDIEKGIFIFLTKNNHLCYKEKHLLKIYDNITEDDLDDEIDSSPFDDSEVRKNCITKRDDPTSLEILKVTKIKKLLENYLSVEKELLDEYHNLSMFKNNDKTIKNIIFLSSFIDLFIKKISSFSKEKLTKYARLLNKLKIEKEGAYDFKDYQSKDIYSRAIFSNKEINCAKASEHILKILNIKDALESNDENFDLDEFDLSELDEDEFFEEQFEENKENDELTDYLEHSILYEELTYLEREYQTTLYFYLKYIENINKYLDKQYDKNLEITKNRLLYLLDRYHYQLFDEINFYQMLQDCENLIVIDKQKALEFLINPIAVITDVFKNEPDIFTTRKLLYLRTYYSLTKDENLKNLMPSYTKNPNYQKYYEIIFNDGLGLTEQKGKTRTK